MARGGNQSKEAAKPGIKEVAAVAGVSPTTVSRVLNNRGYISKETRDKVHAAMERINYAPNDIARAMLKDAPIILLDEATASVDPENEVHLQQAISALVKNKTLIVIAHRLSTIRDADQILVVDNGKIVEKGVHAELIQQKGIYQKFWNIRQKARNWKLAQ